MIRITGLALAAALIAGPLHAQTADPAAAQASAKPAPQSSTPSGLSPAAGNPNLSVASVRMADGTRASKVIGAGIYSDANNQVGSVDDLMMDANHQVVFAIVSVGGVMGMGGKLVAIPVGQLQPGADGKLMLPGATKDSLNAMPTFVY